MRKVGGQFGTTTGRPRRCGWLDLNLVKYTALFNGYDSINITKLDILDQFDEIKVATEYKLDGKTIEYPPASLKDFGRVTTTFETLKGWKKDTTKIRKK